MTGPPEPVNNEQSAGGPPRPPGNRRRVIRAAALRPINLLMLILGAFAAVFFSWWFFPLTLVTYGLLVFLASRDPFFMHRVLGERTSPITSQAARDISPERRARWLPRGETRSRVEKALTVYRAVVSDIEDSGDVARSVLDDAVPKLHATANRIVEVAHNRERAATALSELRASSTSEDHATTLQTIEDQIQTADVELSETYEKLVTLRARAAQVSTANTPEERATAAQINASLEELNARLEALGDTMTPRNS